MLNLLEGMLLTNASGESIDLAMIDGMMQGELPTEGFSELFNALAGSELSPEAMEKMMSQFINEDGSIDREQLVAYLSQQGQKIATETADNSAIKQETINAEHGVSVTGEQQASAKAQVNETPIDTDKGMKLIQSQQALDVDASMESELGNGQQSAKKHNPMLQQVANTNVDVNSKAFNSEEQATGFNEQDKVIQQFNTAKVANGQEQNLDSLSLSKPVSLEGLSSQPMQQMFNMNNAPQAVRSGFQAHNLSVSTPVTGADWAESFGDKVMWLTNQPIKSASIKVTPQELGPIDITLKLNQDQASVQFTSHNAHAKEVIEQALPKLREMMQEQGLNLADVNVSTNSSQHGEKQAHQSEEADKQADSFRASTEQASVSAIVNAKPQGLVDFFA